MRRAQTQLRWAWLAVALAGALLAGARQQLAAIALEHDAEVDRLRGQLDGALEHIHATRPAEDQAPGDDATA